MHHERPKPAIEAGGKAQAPRGEGRRRALFAGIGAAGVVTAATVASGSGVRPSDPVVTEEERAPPARGGGYALTEHVKRYYQTTRV
jgi:hypothetical protein